MENGISIIEIKDGAAKSAFAKETLEKLPQWIGNKQPVSALTFKYLFDGQFTQQ